MLHRKSGNISEIAQDTGIVTRVVTVAGICNSVRGGVFLTCHHGASGGGEYKWVSWLGLLIGKRWLPRLQPAVLECTNCSLQATVEGALSETVVTVSLSTVPRLSQQSGHLQVGKRTLRHAERRVGVVADWTSHAFTWEQMTQLLDDYHCSAKVSGSIQ